uniref:RD22-like protein n=1 Tax=Knorringia sibirica TaxID=328376 RepID=Q0MWZ1_9CARY|nr:RD22-like protein [Knorringia sibirica]
MEFRLPILFFICSILSLGSHADRTLSPEMYWKKVLPNTPMPKAITDSLHPTAWKENKGTTVAVGKGGVGVDTRKPGGGGTKVGVGKGGVGVETGKPGGGGTHVSVGKGGVGVQTGKPYGHGTHVGVGKGGVGVSSGGKKGYRGTHVGVGKGGVTVTTGPKHKPVYVGVHPGPSPFIYNYAATETQLHDDPNVALFFLQKDLKPGNKMTLHFPRSADGATFLPRHVASSIPFSSADFSTILRRFSLAPESDEAAVVKQTIKECERNDAVSGEEKYCATSLESMVDFAVTRLGSKRAVSTDASSDDGRKKEFAVMAVREVSNGGGVVACHKERYPYAVFYCHKTKRTEAYTVELVAEGKVVKAAAVCHKDTSEWNPKHLAFQVLKVKPGTVPICHFLPEDHVIWVRN